LLNGCAHYQGASPAESPSQDSNTQPRGGLCAARLHESMHLVVFHARLLTICAPLKKRQATGDIDSVAIRTPVK
jgi:hypothetical protein